MSRMISYTEKVNGFTITIFDARGQPVLGTATDRHTSMENR
jgi:hypothetical protein